MSHLFGLRSECEHILEYLFLSPDLRNQYTITFFRHIDMRSGFVLVNELVPGFKKGRNMFYARHSFFDIEIQMLQFSLVDL